jgi:prolyl-tRNA synthetase
MYLTPIGEDTLMLCDACGFSANRQVARARKPAAAPAQPLPLEPVATPDCKSIDDLAAFLNVPPAATAKAVFLMAAFPEGVEPRQQFIFAVVRGDMEVNETKLGNLLHSQSLRPATEDEIRTVGAVPGYASPLGVHGARVVVDDAIPASPNLVAGANREGYHLRNVNYGRDFTAEIVADIAAAAEGDGCPQCGAPLRAVRGVEVGNIFKLGTRYSDALGCTYQDANGVERPVIMGSYGIGVGRLLACVAEEHHDPYGLTWPASVAPYPIHLTLLVGKGSTVAQETAERLYADLCAAGLEPLYDDRPESPGVKFNDADLIGLPVRLTVSDRALQSGGVEVKLRSSSDKHIIPLEDVLPRLRELLSL